MHKNRTFHLSCRFYVTFAAEAAGKPFATITPHNRSGKAIELSREEAHAPTLSGLTPEELKKLAFAVRFHEWANEDSRLGDDLA